MFAERKDIYTGTVLGNGQFSEKQGQNSTSSDLRIEMGQTYVAADALEKSPLVGEAPASVIFLGIIYTTVAELLSAVSTTV